MPNCNLAIAYVVHAVPIVIQSESSERRNISSQRTAKKKMSAVHIKYTADARMTRKPNFVMTVIYLADALPRRSSDF